MTANLVFLAMIVTATGLACWGAHVWVELIVRRGINGDTTPRRWL